jgi:hypothetical protein
VKGHVEVQRVWPRAPCRAEVSRWSRQRTRARSNIL